MSGDHLDPKLESREVTVSGPGRISEDGDPLLSFGNYGYYLSRPLVVLRDLRVYGTVPTC